jgi:hypothetical protein
MINYVYVEKDQMTKTQRKVKFTNSFLANDNGKLVTIKQPSIVELNIIYQAIMANKRIVDTIFMDPFKMSEAHGSFLENLEM